MQFQTSPGSEISILEEIFKESSQSCGNVNCRCKSCSSHRPNSNKSISQQVKELGWELSGEEEYELSKAFEKIKNIAKRTHNKAKPLIVTADIIRRLISPPTEPVPKMKDVAAYIEQDKKRQTQDRVKSAQSPAKSNFKQKPPNFEMSLLQEVFMEADYELGAHASRKKPMINRQKNSYRDQVRSITRKTGVPDFPSCDSKLKNQCLNCEGEIHHIVPLELAHLQPMLHPNRWENLAYLPRKKHNSQYRSEDTLKKGLDKVSTLAEKHDILERYRSNKCIEFARDKFLLPQDKYLHEARSRNIESQKSCDARLFKDLDRKKQKASNQEASVLDDIFAELSL